MSRSQGPVIDKAVSIILSGMHVAADVIGSTYGPNGRNVVIEDDGGNPHITKDGVTVANAINFTDPYYNLGASLIKDAANKTLKEVGDGTTTTAILAYEIASAGLDSISTNSYNPFIFRALLEKYLEEVKDQLSKLSRPLYKGDRDRLLEVALNSANGDIDLATKIVDLFSVIGKDGVTFVRDSDILGVHIQVIDGVSINRGYCSPLFCKNGQSSIVLENCKVLLSKRVVRDYKDLFPFIKQAQKEHKPILLVVPEIDNTVTELFLANTFAGTFEGCVIQAPYSSARQQDFLQDLGVLSGAIASPADLGGLFYFGEVEKVVVGRDNTEFQGFHPIESAYKQHLSFLNDLHDTQTDRFIADKIAERLAMFSGCIGYIHVGASSETGAAELKDKIDDVVHAVQAALEGGTVPAAGQALKWVAKQLLEKKRTFSSLEEKGALDLLVRACNYPASLLGDLKTESQDPTKVVFTALKNAVSVAGVLFTSEYVIVRHEEVAQLQVNTDKISF